MNSLKCEAEADQDLEPNRSLLLKRETRFWVLRSSRGEAAGRGWAQCSAGPLGGVPGLPQVRLCSSDSGGQQSRLLRGSASPPPSSPTGGRGLFTAHLQLLGGAEDRPCVPVPACCPRLGSQLQQRSPLVTGRPHPTVSGSVLCLLEKSRAVMRFS